MRQVRCWRYLFLAGFCFNKWSVVQQIRLLTFKLKKFNTYWCLDWGMERFWAFNLIWNFAFSSCVLFWAFDVIWIVRHQSTKHCWCDRHCGRFCFCFLCRMLQNQEYLPLQRRSTLSRIWSRFSSDKWTTWLCRKYYEKAFSCSFFIINMIFVEHWFSLKILSRLAWCWRYLEYFWLLYWSRIDWTNETLLMSVRCHSVVLITRLSMRLPSKLRQESEVVSVVFKNPLRRAIKG